MRVVLGSQSDKKIEAVKDAFKFLNIDDYNLECYKVSSDVSENPLNEEILQGAKNRNINIYKKVANADMYISIEAGFTKDDDNYYLDTYVDILYNNKEYVGKCPSLKISQYVYNYVKDGNVLHLLVQKLQNTEINDGLIGFLTNGLLKRAQFEASGVVDGLIKALNLNNDGMNINAEEKISDVQIFKLDNAIKNNEHISMLVDE